MAIVVPDHTPAAAVRWRSAALSDRGRRRRRNEDALLEHAAGRLYAVADGMGGHAAGDVASRLAVESLAAAFPRAPHPRIGPATLSRRLLDTFEAANRVLLEHSVHQPECAGMGTTLTVLAPLAAARQCVLAHMGDSRAYRLHEGALVQLTRDHTWVQQQVDAGILTPAQARHHPLASVLNRVLGTPAIGPADTLVSDVAPGDRFLLCTDGLTTMLEDEHVHRLLARPLPLDRLARDLVDAANQAGGLDNITVLVLAADG